VAKSKTPPETGLSLEALQSRSDRLADWIGENPALILGTFGIVLVTAAIVGAVGAARDGAAAEAADALAKVQADYRAAMGALPGSYEVPEPANPETARAVRTEYAAAFAAVIREHAGQSAAALAALDKGEIEIGLGESETAFTTWRDAANNTEGPLAAVLWVRVAGQHEEARRPAEAAAAYEKAAAIETYPLRYRALADAARCRADAGENGQAIALLQRLEAEAPAYAVPGHISLRLMELRAASTQD